MTVLATERIENVPRFLISTTHRIKNSEPKSFWGFFDEDFQSGIFVTQCEMGIDHLGKSQFVIEGVTFDGEEANWAGRVDDINVVKHLNDKRHVFTSGELMPELTLYL